MPRPFPPEFRQRAVELARERAKPIREIASDLGIAESCLRRWMALDDVEAGRKEGMTKDEREELVRLRRENRVLRMEKEILGKAACLLRHRERASAELIYALIEAERPTVPSGCSAGP
jgi:transposase